MRYVKILLVVSMAFLGLRCSVWRAVTKQPAGTQTGSSSLTPPGNVDVEIDHLSGLMSPAGVLRREPGQRVWIAIRNTNVSCYSFDVVTIPLQPPVGNRPAASTDMTETKYLAYDYDGVPTKIVISAKLVDSACQPDRSHVAGGRFPPWEVVVNTYGWDLDFSGGFTVDSLTDPVYGLVAGSKQIDPEPAPKTPGFFVQRFRDQEDRYKLGAAAMAHVFHSDPNVFGIRGINWVPVSFGLGVNQGSQVRYSLGTGVRFGRQFFLTGGVVWGSIKALPPGLSADSETERTAFTTNPAALATLPARTDRGAFLAIAYTIGGNSDPFRAPFKTVAPAPVAGAQSGGSTPIAMKLSIDVKPLANYSQARTHQLIISNARDAGKGTANFSHQLHAQTKDVTWICTRTDGTDCQSLFMKDLTAKTLSASFTDLPPDSSFDLRVKHDFKSGNVAPETLKITFTDQAGKATPVNVTVKLPDTALTIP